MKRPLNFREIRRRQTVADHHINLFVQHQIRHFSGVFSRIRIVAVYHNIASGINFSKHAANDITFALLIFMTHNRTRCFRDFIRMIGGIVVIDVNDSFRQNLLEIGDNFFNCLAFVIAGN